MEHGGAASDFVRSGFESDEGLRHGGRCRFGHIGVRGTRGFGQRIVNLIHVVEFIRHNHLDFTVVLTLHPLDLRIEIERLFTIRCDSLLHRLSGVASVDLRHLHREAGVGFLQLQRIWRIGRHHLVEQRGAVAARHFHAHGASRFCRLHSERRERGSL